eukprot:m.486127 g.486127  ORF g.486127 m.486127 type:complete len:57 (+) comp76615_c0_seq1:46-216(+)
MDSDSDADVLQAATPQLPALFTQQLLSRLGALRQTTVCSAESCNYRTTVKDACCPS